MLSILALNVSQRSPEDKISTQEFDESTINCITIQKHMLEIAVCSLTILIDYPQNLTNVNILGQGNLNLVREKSGNFTFYYLWEP